MDREIDGMTVGMGGSVTMKQMDLYRKLSAHNDVFSNADTPGKTREEISREAQTADIYLSSLNGISENGELINIDGTGNLVSAIQYGHKKVYLIAGSNKVAKDYEA
ncbi:MAG: LUD domain-containing protein, partial [Erysipelotrichaceae bacterium]|nr:LUD domain-containing protein [Erysipelotrichaceae bacterium]